MLKMAMMVETARWNMGGVQVSLKAMKNKVILSVRMECPAPFCEATTKDMYVSCSAAVIEVILIFNTCLSHLYFPSSQSTFKYQHIFKGHTNLSPLKRLPLKIGWIFFVGSSSQFVLQLVY